MICSASFLKRQWIELSGPPYTDTFIKQKHFQRVRLRSNFLLVKPRKCFFFLIINYKTCSCAVCCDDVIDTRWLFTLLPTWHWLLYVPLALAHLCLFSHHHQNTFEGPLIFCISPWKLKLINAGLQEITLVQMHFWVMFYKNKVLSHQQTIDLVSVQHYANQMALVSDSCPPWKDPFDLTSR